MDKKHKNNDQVAKSSKENKIKRGKKIGKPNLEVATDTKPNLKLNMELLENATLKQSENNQRSLKVSKPV